MTDRTPSPSPALSGGGHTPGPWTRVDTPDYAEIRAAGLSQPVALVGRAEDADAIASAPSLLEALREAREALEPFADAASDLDDKDRDDRDIWEHPTAGNITAGDLRKAAQLVSNLYKLTALASAQGEKA